MVEGIRVIRVWSLITSNDGTLKQSLDYLSFICIAVLAVCFVHKIGVKGVTYPQCFTAAVGIENFEVIIYSGNVVEVILGTGSFSNYLIPPRYFPELDVEENNWCLEVRFNNPTNTSIVSIKSVENFVPHFLF